MSKGSLCGFLQKKLNKDVYDKHLPLTREDLKLAHSNVGFRTIYCDYTIALNLSVVHYKNSQNYLQKLLARLSKVLMLIIPNKTRGTKKFASHVYYVGLKTYTC